MILSIVFLIIFISLITYHFFIKFENGGNVISNFFPIWIFILISSGFIMWKIIQKEIVSDGMFCETKQFKRNSSKKINLESSLLAHKSNLYGIDKKFRESFKLGVDIYINDIKEIRVCDENEEELLIKIDAINLGYKTAEFFSNRCDSVKN